MAKIITIKHEDGKEEVITASEFILLHRNNEGVNPAINGVSTCSKRFFMNCIEADVLAQMFEGYGNSTTDIAVSTPGTPGLLN
jgi:hypothetical protein